MAARDDALTCCLNIQALADLLECSRPDLNPATITRTGLLILEEVRQLQARLEWLITAAEK